MGGWRGAAREAPLQAPLPPPVRPSLPAAPAGVQLYVAWLSYFYLSMALRENVLYVNGSRIKAWCVGWVAAEGQGPRPRQPQRCHKHTSQASQPQSRTSSGFPTPATAGRWERAASTRPCATTPLWPTNDPVADLVRGPALHRWMEHHYWSCGASLLLLGLPVSSPGGRRGGGLGGALEHSAAHRRAADSSSVRAAPLCPQPCKASSAPSCCGACSKRPS
jgi:hypothetical protein